MSLKHRRPKFDILQFEDRITPSAAYQPPSVFLFRPEELNSAPSREEPLQIAKSFLAANAFKLGATAADFDEAIVKSQFTDPDSGTTHIYFRQTANGLEVAQADMNVAVGRDGRVTSVGGGFVRDLASTLNQQTPAPLSTALDAINWTEAIFEATDNQPTPGCGCTICTRGPSQQAHTVLSGKLQNQVYQASNDVEQNVLIASKLSLEPIPARLAYVPNAEGGVDLTWELTILTTDGNHWYNLNIDDATGVVALVSDWTADAGYHTVPLPNENPNDGGYTVLADPHLANASPFGWHDTNGAAGAEFTDTRGNNVDARLDRDNNNSADPSPGRPTGGSLLNFSTYVYEPTQSPLEVPNQFAAQVNLFVVNNQIHDIAYQYGFTPAAGNFQTNNYGQGGAGNDAVLADAQDGSGTNNANFSTPPDGTAPRMQMFIWTAANPDRDSDLDNGVIIHEYGHGISNRLTGGAANSNALSDIQSRGMGEGWSDFFALMLQQRPTDTQNGGYGIGTYLQNQPGTGVGIRAYRYSYDMGVDPIMWDSYGTSGTTSYGLSRSTAVHRTGTVWASALWDMNWLLINKHGYDSDITTGYSNMPGAANAGNKLALRLVIDALKLQPATPSFTEARDAILAADQALTGGDNHLQIWQAFARRGLGENAVDGGSTSTALIVTDDTIPGSVQTLQIIGHTPVAQSILAGAPSSFTLNFTDAINAATLNASDLTVNGIPATSVSYSPGSTSATFNFTTTPVTANGLQTMAVASGAFTRASDANPVQDFLASFRYDPVKLTVSSTTPASGSQQAPSLTSFDVNFNEAVLPASVSTNDLRLSTGYATAFTLLNGNTTVRYTLIGLDAESTFTATIIDGAITDVDGNGNAEFVGSYVLDYTTQPLGPLTAIDPLGSQVYAATISGIVNTTSDIDEFTVEFQAGEAITAVLTPDSGLRSRVTVLTPTNTQLSIVTASNNGQTIATPTAVAPVTGTYTVRVQGVASTDGSYTLDVQRNATRETESIQSSATNDTSATAQSLNSSLIEQSTAAGSAKRAAVIGSTDVSTAYVANSVPYAFEDISSTGSTILVNADDVTSTVAIPFSFNFYGTGYTSLSVSDNGLITFGGSTTSNSNGSLTSAPSQAAIAVLWDDLENGSSGIKNQVLGTPGNRRLVIQWDNVRYWTSSNSGSFTLRFQAVLFEGSNQIRLNYEDLDGNVSNKNGGVSASIGIKDSNTGGSPKLLLSQNSTSSFHGNGVSTIISPPAATKDFYSFSAAAGETVSLVADALAAGNLGVELFDIDGTSLLATGSSGASNFTAGVANFVIPAAGTYYAAVTGETAAVPYNLVVLQDAAFDSEANNSGTTAQPLGASDSAFGALASGNDDWYSLVMPANTSVLRVETATPGTGNTLNPALRFYNSVGTVLLATGTALPDGRNETLTVTGLTPGATYTIRLSAANSGDYLVTSRAVPSPTVDSVVINAGEDQRSRVTTIAVTFSDQVNLASGAFALSNGTFTLTSNPAGGILTGSSVVGSQTVALLTFDAVVGVDFGSLADGIWTLTVVAAAVTSIDGAPMLANDETTDIKRLFGDINGDGTVDGSIDFAAFGNEFGASPGIGGSAFDFNNDGFIDGAVDFAQFGNRFGMTL